MEDQRGELAQARGEARDAAVVQAETPHGRRGESGGGRRRKAGGPAPIEQEPPGEKLDGQQDEKQGAPAAALNPEDGSDSSDDSNDSKN
ncbi:hypothetical protein D9M68_210020 [compost metagenome]